MGIFARLDAYGLDDVDNNEGQVNDVCNRCDRRVVDHPGHELAGVGDGSAKWKHRRAAFLPMLADLDGCGDLR